MSNGDGADVANLLELALQNLGYTKEQIVHYSFLTEEALIQWRETLPAEAELRFERRDTQQSCRITISLPGEMCDPFRIGADTDEPLTKMADRLLSGVGSEIQYRYRRGVNQLLLRLPKNNAEERIFGRNLLLMMIPIALQQLLETTASNADAIMLGFLDSGSMSAVSLVANFAQIHIYLISGMIIGTTALISQYWGIRDRKTCRAIASISTKTAMLLSAVFAGAVMFFPRQILKFYTNIPELWDCGVIYLRFIAVAMFIAPLYRIPYCAMYSTGRVKTSVRYAMTGCVANLVLNALFLFVFRMGIMGAGLATVLSGVLQVILVFFDSRREDAMKLDFRVRLIGNHVFRQFVVKASPATIQFLVYIIGNNILVSAFGHMGKDILAANAMLLIVFNMVVTVGRGLERGAAILMGNLLGKGKLELAWKRSRLLYRYGWLFGFILASLFALLSYILRFLPVDLSEGAIGAMNWMLVFYSINTVFNVLNGITNTGMLHAGGDSIGVLIADVIVMWGILVPFALLGTHVITIPAWIMIAVLRSDEVISFPLKYARYRKRKWLNNMTEG